MIALLFILGVLLVAVSARLLAHAIAVPTLDLRRHLGAIRDYGFQRDPALGPQPSSRGHLIDAMTAFAERVGRFAITNLTVLHPLRRGELAAAGFYDTAPEAVHGYRALTAVFLATFVFLSAVLAAGVSLISILMVAAAAAAGWQLPAVVIRSRGKARLYEVDKELPELIDLLIATIEAGMGFGGSLALIANRLQGPLGDEVRLTIRQQNLGISTTAALEDMLERCESPSMRSFVKTVTRGEAMGLSIAPILRELTTDMRRRRRQAAQEKMHKAPVKILFPLMFLVMPALGIVLFYPVVYAVSKGLGHG
jgi:tight adherence protein C